MTEEFVTSVDHGSGRVDRCGGRAHERRRLAIEAGRRGTGSTPYTDQLGDPTQRLLR